MITYSYIHTFIISNLIIVLGLFLIGKVSKKASRITGVLIPVCWLVYSWYFQLRLDKHLPSDLHSNHIFLGWFLTIVYGFGCWISIMLSFVAAVMLISTLVKPGDTAQKKVPEGTPDHSPWPLWIAGLIVGLLGFCLLNASLVPVLNRLMDTFTNLIYVKLLHTKALLPTSYLPVAGIAAGTIITACFTRLYRRSKLPFVWFFSLILVPVLTAVLAPLVDFVGSILVLVLAFTAFKTKDNYVGKPARKPAPYILLALGIGCLSGLYFQAAGVSFMGNETIMTLVGGAAAGITIACLAYRSYCYEASKFRALYFLAFIPFITPAFGSAIAYIISLICAFILLFAIRNSQTEETRSGRKSSMRTQNGDPVYDNGNGSITFSENGQLVDATESSYMDTYITSDNREYVKSGNALRRVR